MYPWTHSLPFWGTSCISANSHRRYVGLTLEYFLRICEKRSTVILEIFLDRLTPPVPAIEPCGQCMAAPPDRSSQRSKVINPTLNGVTGFSPTIRLGKFAHATHSLNVSSSSHPADGWVAIVLAWFPHIAATHPPDASLLFPLKVSAAASELFLDAIELPSYHRGSRTRKRCSMPHTASSAQTRYCRPACRYHSIAARGTTTGGRSGSHYLPYLSGIPGPMSAMTSLAVSGRSYLLRWFFTLSGRRVAGLSYRALFLHKTRLNQGRITGLATVSWEFLAGLKTRSLHKAPIRHDVVGTLSTGA